MTYAAPSFESKICPPEQLTARAGQIARPLVFTNGCFDILHRGHVTYLAQARTLGASMVVGVNSDASVKRQGKGEDRPINAEDDRMAVLAALSPLGDLLLATGALEGPYRRTRPITRWRLAARRFTRALLAFLLAPRIDLTRKP